MGRFVDENKNNWQRLENLLEIIETSSLKRLSNREIREFGDLYRRAATDLAVARAETRDPKLINYLNSLVIRAHGKIYRAENQGLSLLWNFFARDFPRVFRETWNYTFLAFAVFTFFGIASFLLAFYDMNFVDMLGLGNIKIAAQNNDQWWLDLNKANQIGATGILANNIMVSFRAFAFGAFFGIGTILVLVYNGLMIGGVLGVCYKVSPAFGNSLVTFMVGHGVVELSCIFIAGGAGMLIGYSIINPGDKTRVEALKKNGIKAVKLAIGCACLLVIAGIIEGFISPAAIPAPFKYATGILTGVAMYVYLLLAGRKEDPKEILQNQ